MQSDHKHPSKSTGVHGVGTDGVSEWTDGWAVCPRAWVALQLWIHLWAATQLPLCVCRPRPQSWEQGVPSHWMDISNGLTSVLQTSARQPDAAVILKHWLAPSVTLGLFLLNICLYTVTWGCHQCVINIKAYSAKVQGDALLYRWEECWEQLECMMQDCRIWVLMRTKWSYMYFTSTIFRTNSIHC